MLSTTARHRSYLNVLNEKILPWLKSGNLPRLILIEPPLNLPPGVSSLNIRYQLFRERRNLPSILRQHRWVNEGLETMRFVELGCVLEGEADYLFGTELESDDPESNIGYNVQALTLPERTFFIVPPVVARPDGSRPHWERPQQEKARSRIFWLLFIPSGASGHICTSEGLRHISHERFFVRDDLLESLVTALLEELRVHTPNSDIAALGLLFTILTRVARAMEAGNFLAGGIDESEKESAPSTLSPLVRQVCKYIQAHLHQPLSLPRIAAHCYVSPSHLSRCFRKEIGNSVIKYVIQCRIDAATQLLTNKELSHLAIQTISSMVGFTTPEYFTRTFTRRHKVSPTRFRETN